MLPASFYQRDDVVKVARELVGKVLCTSSGNDEITSGIITETEAYCGRGDKASHAKGGTRTARTETMYQSGGCAYVYLCYGIHHLFNVVTNKKGKADAVLIRAVKPLSGTEFILQRRKSQNLNPALTAGPGRLTEALGITTEMDGTSLTGRKIWIEDHNFGYDKIVTARRIGVDYAGEDAKLPWRFYPKNCKWVSNKRK